MGASGDRPIACNSRRSNTWISSQFASIASRHHVSGTWDTSNWVGMQTGGQQGVLVYYIDTTKDIDRSGESQGIVKEAWSKYVTPTTDTSPDPSNALNKLMLQGDTVKYKGTMVTLTKPGDVDTVRITK